MRRLRGETDMNVAASKPTRISYRDAEIAFQRGLIESALEQAGGVQKRAAELLHIKPTTLNEMIKRHDIRPRRRRVAGTLARPESPVETDDLTDEGEEVASLDRD